eukprot:429523-Pyramimonas_sp.AAC.1
MLDDSSVSTLWSQRIFSNSYSHGIQRPGRGKAHDWTRDGAGDLSLVFGQVGVGTTSHFT